MNHFGKTVNNGDVKSPERKKNKGRLLTDF